VRHRRTFLTVALLLLAALIPSAAAAKSLKVTWLPGVKAASTPAKYDKVGVIKVGPAKAHNVLVLEPGTSAGGSYFIPLAQWIVSSMKGWQVWSVERRENLLEDQSVLTEAKHHKASSTKVFNYYLGYLTNSKVKHHFQSIPTDKVEFAKQWGLKVAVGDLHRVIGSARKLGGKVVLAGHSLGGSVVTAYATWNFGGHPGASDLAGLVYIDGSSFGAVSAAAAHSELNQLNQPNTTPWLVFGGIPAPFAGLFNATGSLGALQAPNQPSLGQEFPLLPADLKPKVRVTNLGQYGFALNVGTSPPALAAAQAHLGKGVAAKGPVHGWNGKGALTPIKRFATMFSGIGIDNADGTEWYFPQRLTDDTGAIDNGNANPAQKVLGVNATFGHKLPKRLRIYAFGAALGDGAVLAATRALAKQSGIPRNHLTLIDRHKTYAHNDPNGAYPHNVFFANLLPFLRKIGAQR
jgi:pimeloyl-ACP methyl ester carboxylesterase